MTILTGILGNPVLLAALTAWFIAQGLKVIIYFSLRKKFDLQLFVSSGGFPSSHSAAVSSLAIGIGKYNGWSSPDFAIAAVLALVVMYDATGVRRAAGKQAEVLNQLVERFYQGSDVQQERLKELIGHTPFEVFGGALLGIIVGVIS